MRGGGCDVRPFIFLASFCVGDVVSWRVSVQKVDFDTQIRYYAGNRHVDGALDIIRPVEITRRQEGEPIGYAEPFLTLDGRDGEVFNQSLIDSLWLIGFRPSENLRGESQIGAITNHLNDMRVIVGHKLGVKL